MRSIRLLLLSVNLSVGLAISSALAVPIPVYELDPESPAQIAYENGLRNVAAGDLAAADAAFRTSLRLQPSQVASFLGLADVAFARKQIDQARDFLQRALKVNPNNAAAQTGWGRYLHLQGRFNEAETAFIKAIELDAKLVDAHVELGALYLVRLAQPEKAVNAYRQAIALDPSRLELRYALSSALAAAGNVDEAVVTLRQLAKIVPDDPYPLQLLGTMYAREKDYPKALEAFTQALKVQPQLAQAHWARGEIYLLEGQDTKALSEYQRVLKIEPKSAQALFKIGLIHQRHQRTTKAERAYLDAVAIEPKLAIAYNNLAFGAAERGERLDDALKWANHAVALEPNNPEFQDTVGWVLRARGELKAAAAALEKSRALHADQPDLHYHLGVVYMEMGEATKAAQALKKALEVAPDFSAAGDAERRLSDLQGR